MSRPLAALLLLACTCLWGFAFVAQKSAMDSMEPLTFSAVRYAIGTILVLPLAWIEFRRKDDCVNILMRHKFKVILLCLAFFFGTWLQQAALVTNSATSGGFLTSFYVIFTPIVAFMATRLHPHPIVYPGAVLALVGLYFMTGADLSQMTAGDLMLLACALCWAVQIAFLGVLAKDTGLPFTLSILSFAAGMVLSGINAVILEQPSLAGISTGWLELLYAGVLSTAVAFSLQAVAQQYVPPGNAALILATESLFAAIGAAWLLGERLPPTGYLGAALIFTAIVMVEHVSSRRSHS